MFNLVFMWRAPLKAAVCYENGGPNVLLYEDVPDPACSPTGVVIDVTFISVEGGDILHRSGSPLPTSPHIVGYASAGRVREVGADVQDRRVGDLVVALGPHGSHAERVATEAAMTWLVPEGADLKFMVCVPVAFATAHEALFELGQLKARERVLVIGAAGGVGLAAVQLARAAGAEVIASASSDEKLARLLEYGASHVVNYVSAELVTAIAEAVGPNAVDLVIDPVGGNMLKGCVSCLGYRGRIVSLGLAGREATPFNPLALWEKNNALHGLGLMNSLQNEYARVYAVVAECMQRVFRGELNVVVDKVFSLADAAEAHATMESRSIFGRVVLKV